MLGTTIAIFNINLCYPHDLITTGTIIPMLIEVMSVVPREKIAVHFHDTYGQALPNILASLQVSKGYLCNNQKSPAG